MKQTILFLYNGRMSYLPPFQALVDSLLATNQYHIEVISSEYEDEIDKLYEGKDINFKHYYTLEPRTGLASRVRNKYKTSCIFKKNIAKDVSNIKYDVLWVIHERTGVMISSFLKDRKYILSIYELNDGKPKLREQLMPVAQRAKVNVICERNRAWIMKAWYNLKEYPVVLPNKPYSHQRTPNLPCDKIKKDERKILLYQGYITRDRNLEGFCKALNDLDDFKLVFMGGADPDYLNELQTKYQNVEYIGYIKSPFHLYATSHAYIGVVTYDPETLNRIYCAPNKIWEYAGFGIPMIANDIPGLTDTVGKFNAGLCVDTDDSLKIRAAIKEIDSNYQQYRDNATLFYESCNITDIILSAIKRYEK